MPSFKPVASLGRGLEVLRVVNDEREATVGSVHRATGLDKATIVRLLETLEHAGYIMRDAARAVYAPTGRCLLLSRGYDRHLWIGRIAEPRLRELREAIGWPCELALLDQDAMIIVDTGRPQIPMFYVRQPGFRVPVLGSSLGIAYLAYCDAGERVRIVAGLARRPGRWNDLARQPPVLERLLMETRERGYALSDPDYVQEVFKGKLWALGVPVRHGAEVFGSINAMMMRGAMEQQKEIATCVALLWQAAEQIATALAQPPSVASASA